MNLQKVNKNIDKIDIWLKIILRFSESVDKDEIQNKKALAAIQESVIGFTGSLENKTFLHEGALIELDPESYRPICRVYFFLLNDLLIVGKVKHDKYVENRIIFMNQMEIYWF